MPFVSFICLLARFSNKKVLSIYFWARYGKGNHFSQKSWLALRAPVGWELDPCIMLSPKQRVVWGLLPL